LKVSIVTSYSNPEERMDPWKEALECYKDFCDELIVVENYLKDEFRFENIGEMFQEGYERATGDWVIKMDIDTLIHENDFKSLKNLLKKLNNYPAVSMRKFQFFTPDRFSSKSRQCMVLNKKNFKNIRFNGGGDLCDPTLNGVRFNEKNVPRIKIPFWNYDSTFKTKEIISSDRARFARAWFRTFGNYGDRGGSTSELAFLAWFEMIHNRYRKHIYKLDLYKHPKYIQNKLYNISKNQFGYDAFGLKSKIKRSPKDFMDSFGDNYLSEFKLSINRSYKSFKFQ